jgi:hypothetical protein
MLARMGCSNITVHDEDTPEDFNIPNQMAPLEYVDFPKADALAHLVEIGN